MDLDRVKKIAVTSLAGSHDFSHIERVLRYAKKIHDVHNGNWKIIEAALAIHELTKENLETVRNYLDGFSEDEIKQVVYCIEHHHDFVNKPETIEGKILQDADIIDMLGAIGIARGFMSSGERKLSLVDGKNEYKKKRLALMDCLNLEESRRIATERYEFTKLFFETIDKELEPQKLLGL